MNGHQGRAEIESVGLRPLLRKQQAEAGDIVLLHGDESEVLSHPYLARVWVKSSADLRVPAAGLVKKVVMPGSIEQVTRNLKATHIAHQTFVDPDDLDQEIHQAVGQLSTDRMAIPLVRLRISA